MAVHRDLRQVCEGDDVAHGFAVDQGCSKPDSQTCKWKLFNRCVERDRRQAQVEDGPSPTATDIGVWITESGAEISKVAAYGYSL